MTALTSCKGTMAMPFGKIYTMCQQCHELSKQYCSTLHSPMKQKPYQQGNEKEENSSSRFQLRQHQSMTFAQRRKNNNMIYAIKTRTHGASPIRAKQLVEGCLTFSMMHYSQSSQASAILSCWRGVKTATPRMEMSHLIPPSGSMLRSISFKDTGW